ncbi:VpsP family polysaccharide biosynthesis protein [Glaciecola sp. XM2]|uniref:VpsP family polysaccharide biosynthesis protein n=1 Tax=Glaciecola sp. XM2 TaxID=1914931 RepID=UPI001BDF708E|nr:VpsP family polysaccharide biosynthesis protein [Glaciecola sp. XM2]MBT1452454.1 VpsP family polysaccharide biosynthesis protein [Glaciecola sp. XM2]
MTRINLFQWLKKHATKKQMLTLFVLLIATIGAFHAFRFGYASLDYYSVRNTLEEWQAKGTNQTEQRYKSARSSIASAEYFHPTHPLYADLSGQVAEWGVVTGFEAPAHLQIAKEDYLRATRMRPAWPVTWASLAMIKWRLNEFDEQMLEYLQHAHQLGPQKHEVHILFSQLGLTLYQANHPFYRKIRDKTQTRVLSGLRNPNSRDTVLATIERTDTMRTACMWAQVKETFVYNNVLDCQ